MGSCYSQDVDVAVCVIHRSSTVNLASSTSRQQEPASPLPMSASAVDPTLPRSGCYLASLQCTTPTTAQELVTHLQTLSAYQHPSGDSYVRITTDETLVMLVHSEGSVPFRYFLEREWITGYRSVEFERVDRATLMGLWE
jgi:hypothetical protein